MESMTSEKNAPVSLTLSTSTPICHESGEPAFIVTTTYKCVAVRSIWALRDPLARMCNGVQTRDPDRKYRRIGPDPEILCEDPEYDLSPEDIIRRDTVMMRLDPGDVFSTSYTFSVVKKMRGLIHSDVWNLKDGKKYKLTLWPQRWWWMFEDELPAGSSDEQKRDILSKLQVTKWQPDCSSWFEFKDDRSEAGSQSSDAMGQTANPH
jgi:hypothetical protein